MENMGLIVLAFGLGGPAGILAGLLQAVNHSLVKALLFCATGNVLIRYQSRSLDQVKGMLQAIPVTGALILVGALALVGVPPFNLFVSKFLIITAGLGAGYAVLMLVCLVLLTVIFAAFFRVLASTLFGEKPDGLGRGEANWLTLAPGVVLLLLILALGLYLPPQLMTLLHQASGLVLTGNPGPAAAAGNLPEFLLPLAQGLP
jgi:hydrogenase-4 component F